LYQTATADFDHLVGIVGIPFLEWSGRTGGEGSGMIDKGAYILRTGAN